MMGDATTLKPVRLVSYRVWILSAGAAAGLFSVTLALAAAEPPKRVTMAPPAPPIPAMPSPRNTS
jgi:hypothetical protein